MCKDADRGCPHCHGECRRPATVRLYRVDYADIDGTAFCAPCAEDAMEAGVFAPAEEEEER